MSGSTTGWSGYGAADPRVTVVGSSPGSPADGGPASSSQVTVGIAISVPPPHGPRLQRWRSSFGDALGDAVPAHVTLLPPSPVAVPALPAVREHLARVAASVAGFRVRLRGTGSFRPVSSVVFVRIARGRARCAQLERAVRSGPLQLPSRFTYHPHVTVAHDVDDAALDRAEAALADFDATFGVTGFGLFSRGRDGVWRPAEHFALGAAR